MNICKHNERATYCYICKDERIEQLQFELRQAQEERGVLALKHAGLECYIAEQKKIRYATATSGGSSPTDGAPAVDVLKAVRICAQAWQPNVRILGNVRAIDVERAITEVLESATPAVTGA